MKIGKYEFEICTDGAGLLTIWGGSDHQSINFHFFPEKEHRLWGYEEDYYDGPLFNIGLGPLLMVCGQLDFYHIKETIKEYFCQ